MNDSLGFGPRAPDDVLIRYLDGEMPADEARALEARLAPADRERLDELRATSVRFGDLVQLAEMPPLPEAPAFTRRRRGFELRAASVALLVTAGAAAAIPASREAVVDAAREVGHRLAGPAVTGGPDASSHGAATVRFGVTGRVFSVEVDVRQTGGSLILERAAGDVVEASTADAAAELIVLPDGLLVRNSVGSSADLLVALPAVVTTVRVRVGGDEREVALPEDRSRVEVPLSE